LKPAGEAALAKLATVLAGITDRKYLVAGHNDTPEHRTQNRRIEIVLQPNLLDLPSLDGVQTAKQEPLRRLLA
jgi:outer membrane protein OmpA-like peptidoglycan-associated protein